MTDEELILAMEEHERQASRHIDCLRKLLDEAAKRCLDVEAVPLASVSVN